MQIGHRFKIKGVEFEITHIDPDNGEVTVKDGTKFASQTIPDGADIPVDKGSLKAPKIDKTVEDPCALDKAESPQQQKRRLEKEAADAETKRKADEAAARAATKEREARAQATKRLGGNLGSAGQGGLFVEAWRTGDALLLNLPSHFRPVLAPQPVPEPCYQRTSGPWNPTFPRSKSCQARCCQTISQAARRWFPGAFEAMDG